MPERWMTMMMIGISYIASTDRNATEPAISVVLSFRLESSRLRRALKSPCSSSTSDFEIALGEGGTGFFVIVVDCWYRTPPTIVNRRHTKPGKLACLSQINTLITTVRSLFTTPVTVNAVAEIAFLAANPKKLMANPNRHDNPTEKNDTTHCLPSKEAWAISRYSPIATKKKGESMSERKLLYNTNPHVLSPMSVTMCLMYTISVHMVIK